MKVIELEQTPLNSLRQMAKELKVKNFNRLKREDLILKIQQAEAEREGLELRGGILEIMSEGIGFLRSGHYQPGPYDIYVSQSQIRRYGLRNGDLVIGHNKYDVVVFIGVECAYADVALKIIKDGTDIRTIALCAHKGHVDAKITLCKSGLDKLEALTALVNEAKNNK